MATRIEKTDLARDALYDKVNTMTGNAGKFLTTDGTNASWGDAAAIILRKW